MRIHRLLPIALACLGLALALPASALAESPAPASTLRHLPPPRRAV